MNWLLRFFTGPLWVALGGILADIVKQIAALFRVGGTLLLAGCLTLTAGCKIILGDDGEIGFKQSTSWGFYHTAKKTEATSTSELQPMSLEAWFKNEEAKATIPETQ